MSSCNPSILDGFVCFIAQLDVQDVSGWTRLHRMVRCGRIELIDTVMMRGANLEIQNNMVMNPLKRTERRIDGAIEWADMGTNEAPSAADPLVRFGAVAVLECMLRDIDAGKRGVLATNRKELGRSQIDQEDNTGRNKR